MSTEASPDKVSHASLNGIYVKAQEMDRGHNAQPAPSFAPPGDARTAASAADAQAHASNAGNANDAASADAQSHASSSDAQSRPSGADAPSHASEW